MKNNLQSSLIMHIHVTRFHGGVRCMKEGIKINYCRNFAFEMHCRGNKVQSLIMQSRVSSSVQNVTLLAKTELRKLYIFADMHSKLPTKQYHRN